MFSTPFTLTSSSGVPVCRGPSPTRLFSPPDHLPPRLHVVIIAPTLIPMSDNEDDYLSDKFLAELQEASKPKQQKSYTERRKQALRQSQLRNEQHRKKSRKQMELEAREEGLQKSLIQKAQEEAQETGKQNKALAIMMKMGFKPGDTLGENHEESLSSASIGEASGVSGERNTGDAGASDVPLESRFVKYKHRAEPLTIKEWSGESHNCLWSDFIDP